MADLYSTDVLVTVLQDLSQPRSFLLDTFFPNLLEDPSEEIHFDLDQSKPRITPFVSPLVAGKVVEGRGYRTATFKPAYAKDKRRLRPNAPLKRAIGEQIGGTLSPMERRQIQLRTEMEDQLAMLTRREEVMAAEGLRLGRVTVSGEGFPTAVVDFGRDPSLNITLAGAARWNQTGADVIGNLEAWGVLPQDVCGAVSRTVVMHPGVWPEMRKRLIEQGWDVATLGLLRSGGSQLEMGPQAATKDRYVYIGRIGTFDLWTYNDVYLDDAGVQRNLIDPGELLIAGPDVEGTRCYAAIQDEEAGYEAARYFTKSWLEKDPAVRWLLLQSAPLPVPFRVNATVRVKAF